MLTSLLHQHGLERTWKGLLKSHLRGRQDLAYIFSSPEFSDTVDIEEDIISGLSIGEISVLYEFSHAVLDPSTRKSQGLFFTPDDVAAYMASFAQRFPDGTWLDPCAGIGNLTWHLTAAQPDPEHFLLNRMVLIDRDELALLVGRTLLTATFQRHEADLFYKLRDNFKIFDFLSVAEGGVMSLFDSAGTLDQVPPHDYVIANPPYLATEANHAFETAEARDLYAYFLENIIKSSKGFISITPQSFTNAAKFESLRRLLLSHFTDFSILCFDNIPGNIFKGVKFGSTNTNTANSIRVAITIALPGEGQPHITSLLRWKSSEREKLFQEAEYFLSQPPISERYFPKVSSVFIDLYRALLPKPPLADLVMSAETPYLLHIASSPRYFITATKTQMNRTSSQVLYFPDSETRDRAYLLLNSSLMYWWWRVRDGGMTLALTTLHSLPVPQFPLHRGLIEDLERSEQENRVYKQNAGAPRENVKHPMDLVDRLNKHVCPVYAHQLLLTHENSEFVQSKFLSGISQPA